MRRMKGMTRQLAGKIIESFLPKLFAPSETFSGHRFDLGSCI